MNAVVKILSLVAGINFIFAAHIFAGPPFLTDDPEPVDFQHWEFYFFGTDDYDGGAHTINAPAIELNYGVLPDTQLHLIVPMTTAAPDHGTTFSGLGDIEFGVKYRFLDETNWWPQIGIFPMIELPTGDSGRGLGNGQPWFRLPLWLQKSFGPWTTYGGGGAVVNPAPGARDYPFGGWLVQRDLGKCLTLGGEIFAQGAGTTDDHGFAALNFGGYYKFTEHFNLLFSAGHSVAGNDHTFCYLGFYWTW